MNANEIRGRLRDAGYTIIGEPDGTIVGTRQAYTGAFHFRVCVNVKDGFESFLMNAIRPAPLENVSFVKECDPVVFFAKLPELEEALSRGLLTVDEILEERRAQ